MVFLLVLYSKKKEEYLLLLLSLFFYFTKYLCVCSLISRMEEPVTGDVPILKIFTKHPCPLCDEFKLQVDEVFKGRLETEMVDINHLNNARFKKLYRYEIPVAFMNGLFVCKNRLDVEAIKRRLKVIDDNKNRLF